MKIVCKCRNIVERYINPRHCKWQTRFVNKKWVANGTRVHHTTNLGYIVRRTHTHAQKQSQFVWCSVIRFARFLLLSKESLCFSFVHFFFVLICVCAWKLWVHGTRCGQSIWTFRFVPISNNWASVFIHKQNIEYVIHTDYFNEIPMSKWPINWVVRLG